jgi:hypothetical protein
LIDESGDDAQANSPLAWIEGRALTLLVKPNAISAVARSQLNY